MKGEQASPSRFADGTRPDVRVQSSKGLRIATRCETVEQFVSSFHRFCEDAAIFIPNRCRALGAVTAFSFDLVGGRAVLAGVGAVVEELTTAENRFGRPGIVIALQQLGRGSQAVFQRVLAERERARASLSPARTPATVLARAVTGAAALDEPQDRCEASDVQIPNPAARPDRAKTVLGTSTTARAPASSFKVPVIIAPLIPRAELEAAKAKRTPQGAPATTAKVAKSVGSPSIATRPPELPKVAKSVGSPSIATKPAAPPKSRTPGSAPEAVDAQLDVSWGTPSEARAAIPEAVPALAPTLDAIPEALPEVEGDTIRDVIPYALHHAIGNAAHEVTPRAPTSVATSAKVPEVTARAAASVATSAKVAPPKVVRSRKTQTIPVAPAPRAKTLALPIVAVPPAPAPTATNAKVAPEAARSRKTLAPAVAAAPRTTLALPVIAVPHATHPGPMAAVPRATPAAPVPAVPRATSAAPVPAVPASTPARVTSSASSDALIASIKTTQWDAPDAPASSPPAAPSPMATPSPELEQLLGAIPSLESEDAVVSAPSTAAPSAISGTPATAIASEARKQVGLPSALPVAGSHPRRVRRWATTAAAAAMMFAVSAVVTVLALGVPSFSEPASPSKAAIAQVTTDSRPSTRNPAIGEVANPNVVGETSNTVAETSNTVGETANTVGETANTVGGTANTVSETATATANESTKKPATARTPATSPVIKKAAVKRPRPRAVRRAVVKPAPVACRGLDCL